MLPKIEWQLMKLMNIDLQNNLVIILLGAWDEKAQSDWPIENYSFRNVFLNTRIFKMFKTPKNSNSKKFTPVVLVQHNSKKFASVPLRVYDYHFSIRIT